MALVLECSQRLLPHVFQPVVVCYAAAAVGAAAVGAALGYGVPPRARAVAAAALLAAGCLTSYHASVHLLCLSLPCGLDPDHQQKRLLHLAASRLRTELGRQA